MARIAFTFPGQGSQRPGMGAPFTGTPGWSLVDRAGEALGRDLGRLLTEADAEELRTPREAQLSTYLTSLLVLDALCGQRAPAELGVVAVAGHSLGEYTALVAAGVLTPDEGVRLVSERGEAMQAAARDRPGAMAAVLGAAEDVVERVCAEARASGAQVWPANDNGPGHVVISGTAEGIEAVREPLAAAGARRVLAIPVGGAYHTPLMAPAQQRLDAALDAAPYAEARLPVTTNVDACPHTAAADWRGLLSAQLTSPVRWRQSLAVLAADGVTALVEVGPGGVLTGLAKRGAPGVAAYAVATPEDAADVRRALAEAASS
ncbi:MAG: ACP S-malonyltransferase [Actinomycetota bacterium]|nr:ACP S-malonyltransferase [Actinomycetota bacterium]